MTERC